MEVFLRVGLISCVVMFQAIFTIVLFEIPAEAVLNKCLEVETLGMWFQNAVKIVLFQMK